MRGREGREEKGGKGKGRGVGRGGKGGKGMEGNREKGRAIKAFRQITIYDYTPGDNCRPFKS